MIDHLSIGVADLARSNMAGRMRALPVCAPNAAPVTTPFVRDLDGHRIEAVCHEA